MFFPARCVLTLALLVLGACVPAPGEMSATRIAASAKECLGVTDRSSACYFRNSPVRLEDRVIRLAGRPLEFRPIAEPLEFVDGNGRAWVAPRRTLTDGASIPTLFIPIVGNPTSREFVNAAAVHDAFCGIGNEDGEVYQSRTWQETHRVFYDSLIVGGTEPRRAKVMFAAVWLGGPRWELSKAPIRSLTEVLPAAVLTAGMREAKLHIERSNPSMPELIGYLIWLERDMLRRSFDAKDAAPVIESPPPEGTPFDPNAPGQD